MIEEATVIRKINTLLGKYLKKNAFQKLTEEEFDTLLELLDVWYRYGESWDFDEDHEFKELSRKLAITKLPPKIYRGLAFSTEKARTNFIKKIKKTPTLAFGDYSSWSSSKKIAKNFAAEEEKFGVLLTLKGASFRKNFVFSLESVLKTDKDKKIFFDLILSKFVKHAKYINKNNLYGSETLMTDHMDGAMYALSEKEYICRDPLININKNDFIIETLG